MPHHYCCIQSCRRRINSNIKPRRLRQVDIKMQMIAVGWRLPNEGVICEQHYNELRKLYRNLNDGIPIAPNFRQNQHEHAVVQIHEHMPNQENAAVADHVHNDNVIPNVVQENEVVADHLLNEDEDRVNNEDEMPMMPNMIEENVAVADSVNIEDEMPMMLNENLENDDPRDEYGEISRHLLDPFPMTQGSNNSEISDELFEFGEEFIPEIEFSQSGDSVLEFVSANSSQQSHSEPTRLRKRRRLTESNTDKIHVKDMLTVPSSQQLCCVCHSRGKGTRCRIQEQAGLDLWIKHRIYLPTSQVRACGFHLKPDGSFKDEAVPLLKQNAGKGAFLTSEELEKLLNQISDRASVTGPPLNFDTDLPDSTYKLLTGLLKQDFDHLLGYIAKVNNSKNRSKRNALAMTLLLLRQGISQTFIGYLFKIAVQRVSEIVDKVIQELTDHFVPRYLGFDHLTREESNKHVPEYVKKLYDINHNSTALVCDATYLYIQKAQDFKSQRETYSVQKYRNLVKPMMVVFPNGYILEADGLYKANGANNDAGILKSMLRQPNGISKWIQPGDHFILDRGFRDVQQDLENSGFTMHMPTCIYGKKSFSWQAANESRKVTLTRWSVEAVNGRVKHVFKFMDQTIHNSYVFGGKLNKMFRFCCALLNAFYEPLYTDQNKHERILKQVENRMTQRNQLKELVIEKGWERQTKSKWNVLDDNSVPEFPQFTEEQLFDLTVGVWQIKNAIWYAKQHVKNDSSFKIMLCKEDTNILRARIDSRFSASSHHSCWIKMDPEKIGPERIQSYYCNCKNGERTLGACSHVVAVIWYLGFYRHQDKELKIRSLSDYLLDAKTI